MVGLASTLHVEIVGARRQAQQLFQSTVDLDLPRLEVEFPDALAAGLQGQLEPTLAFGEPPFRKLPRGDVAADREVADHPAALVEYRSVDPFLPALAPLADGDVVVVAGGGHGRRQVGHIALDLLDFVRGRELEEVGADHRVELAATLASKSLVAVDDGAVEPPARHHLTLHVEDLERGGAEVRRCRSRRLGHRQRRRRKKRGQQPPAAVRVRRQRARDRPVRQAERAEPRIDRLGVLAFRPCRDHGTRQQSFRRRADHPGPTAAEQPQ